MYHIKEDKRSRRSARLIGDAMIKCLQDSDFADITVTMLVRVSQVGKATFYRLFDNIHDVLVYLSDRMFQEVMEQAESEEIVSVQEMHLLFLRAWMEQDRLLQAVLDHGGPFPNCASGQVQDLIGAFSVRYPNFSQRELQYMIPTGLNTTVAVLKIWLESGKTETPEELLSVVTKSYRFWADHLTGPQGPDGRNT